MENEFVDGIMDVQLNPKLKASHYCACGFIPLNWVNLFPNQSPNMCNYLSNHGRNLTYKTRRCPCTSVPHVHRSGQS